MDFSFEDDQLVDWARATTDRIWNAKFYQAPIGGLGNKSDGKIPFVDAGKSDREEIPESRLQMQAKDERVSVVASSCKATGFVRNFAWLQLRIKQPEKFHLACCVVL